MLLLNGVKKVVKCIFINKLLIIKDIFKLKNCKVSIILFLCTPPQQPLIYFLYKSNDNYIYLHYLILFNFILINITY